MDTERRGRGGVNAPSRLVGVGLGLLAYALFGIHDAAIKWLTVRLPVPEIVFLRSIAVLAACLIIGRRPLIERALSTPLRAPLLFRGLLTLCAWLCYFTAARSLTLAKLLALYFAAPLMTTLLASPLLGERVGAGRWAAVLVGFLGVMVVTDPWGVPLSVPTLLVLMAASLWGYGVILMRQIARRESSLMQILYLSVVFLGGAGIACIFDWRTPAPFEWALLAGIALFGGLGQFCLFEAARYAPAAVMATVEYSSLLWAFLLGWLIWSDIPGAAVFAGAGLILTAGMLLVFVERRAGRIGQA